MTQLLRKANIFAKEMAKHFNTPNISSWVDQIVAESFEQLNNLTYTKHMYFTPGEVWNTVTKL